MTGKYITRQIALTCLATPEAPKKNIHEQLEETIAERKKIIERLTGAARVIEMYIGTTKAA